MRRGSTTNDRKNIIRFIFTKKGRDMSPIPIFLRKSQKKHQKPNKKSWTFSPSSPPKMWFTTHGFSHFFGDEFGFFYPLDGNGVWIRISHAFHHRTGSGILKQTPGGWWLSGWLTDMYTGHLYLASLSLASKRVPWRCPTWVASASGGRYLGPRPRGGGWVRFGLGPSGGFFLWLKNEGAGFLEANPKKMEGLEWKMRFSIWDIW